MDVVAYIDVGSGAMLLQWVIAGAVGFVLVFRRSISGVLGLLFKKKSNQDKVNEGGDMKSEEVRDETSNES